MTRDQPFWFNAGQLPTLRQGRRLPQ